MIEVAAKMTRQKSRLHVWNESQRDLALEEPVLNLFLFAALKCFDDGPSSVLIQQERRPRGFFEIIFSELTTVDQSKGDAIGEKRSKLFHEIESQCRPAWPQRVQESDLRIQPDAFQSSLAFCSQ